MQGGSGKVRKVTKSSGSPIEFRYDAAGNRVEKKQRTVITRYIRDASGNVMAVYQNNVLTERPIYGSSRLGQLDSASAPGYRRVGLKRYELSNHLGNVLAVVSDRIRMRTDSTWTQVLSRTDYYPFGLEMTGRTRVRRIGMASTARKKTQVDSGVIKVTMTMGSGSIIRLLGSF